MTDTTIRTEAQARNETMATVVASRNQFLHYAMSHKNKVHDSWLDPKHFDILLLRQAEDTLRKALTNVEMAIRCECAIRDDRDRSAGLDRK